MEHKTLTSQHGTVHYWVSGRGADCITFTHGATMDHGMFAPQVEYFGERYKTITWDVPGHGLSRPYRGFSLQEAAHRLVEILDAEAINASHLVGQSMGGFIIQAAARQAPDRVCTLTTIGSSPIQPAYYSALDNWLLSITPAILRLYPYNYLLNTIAKGIALTGHAREYALETLQGYSKNEIADIMGTVYTGLQAYREDFRLPVPVLITYGDTDRTGKVRAYCDRWAASEERPLEVIPESAHNANMDNPAAFNEILADFLKAPINSAIVKDTL
jgi:pimeloyl-ACP methyl ester carboxylesterase